MKQTLRDGWQEVGGDVGGFKVSTRDEEQVHNVVLYRHGKKKL